MKFDSVNTNNRSWQESLDPKLMQRLMRPIAQPGVAGTQLAESILFRMQAMTDRSPLAEQLGQRRHWVAQQSADAVPIVYARPRSDNLGQNVSAADLQPSVQKPSVPVIQAKFARPQELSQVDFSRPSVQQSVRSSEQKRVVIQAKFARPQELSQAARPQELSQADFSRPPIDNQIKSDSPTDSRSREPSQLPLVRAKFPIQPVPNVVKTLVKENSNGANAARKIGPGRSAATVSQTGQKPMVWAKNSRNASGKTLVVQRKLARPVVRKNSSPDGGRSPGPLVFASSTNNVPPAGNGRGRAGNRPVSSHNTVVQRFASSNHNVSSRRNGRGRTGILPANNQIGDNGVIQRLPSSDSFSASPDEMVQRSPTTDLDSDVRSAESRELGNEVNVDVEDLVDIVQRRLMQRLTIETERRGLRGLTRWL